MITTGEAVRCPASQALGTDWQIRPFVTISLQDDQTTIRLDQVKEASGVPAQKMPLVPGLAKGIAQAKAALEAAARLVSTLSPQPVLQPIPVRVKTARRR